MNGGLVIDSEYPLTRSLTLIIMLKPFTNFHIVQSTDNLFVLSISANFNDTCIVYLFELGIHNEQLKQGLGSEKTTSTSFQRAYVLQIRADYLGKEQLSFPQYTK